MKLLEEGFTTFISEQASITSLIGTAPMRLYPVRLRQGTPYPAISYFIVDGDSLIDLGGNQLGRASKRMQLSIWSQDVLQCKQLLNALRLLAAGFLGLWDDVEVAVVDFSYSPEIYDHTAKTYLIACHLLLFHSETTIS